jgi:hypothetical protein
MAPSVLCMGVDRPNKAKGLWFNVGENRSFEWNYMTRKATETDDRYIPVDAEVYGVRDIQTRMFPNIGEYLGNKRMDAWELRVASSGTNEDLDLFLDLQTDTLRPLRSSARFAIIPHVHASLKVEALVWVYPDTGNVQHMTVSEALGNKQKIRAAMVRSLLAPPGRGFDRMSDRSIECILAGPG